MTPQKEKKKNKKQKKQKKQKTNTQLKDSKKIITSPLIYFKVI